VEVQKNIFSYEKITLMNESTTPPTKRRRKRHFMIEGGRGGHTSILEKPSYDQKEPENDPDTIPFIPKGAQMHTKNPDHTST